MVFYFSEPHKVSLKFGRKIKWEYLTKFWEEKEQWMEGD